MFLSLLILLDTYLNVRKVRFVTKEYQQKPWPLFLLWRGIIHVSLRNPEHKYIVGGVSISNQFSNFSKVLMIEFMRSHYYDPYVAQFIRAKKEFKPKRNYNYKCKMLKGKQGTIVIMDAAMWHKSGVASNISRWSMFNLYGPWFHKPYFNYYEMLKNKKNVKITKNLKKLLHFNSMPPKNDDIRLTITTKL